MMVVLKMVNGTVMDVNYLLMNVNTMNVLRMAGLDHLKIQIAMMMEEMMKALQNAY